MSRDPAHDTGEKWWERQVIIPGDRGDREREWSKCDRSRRSSRVRYCGDSEVRRTEDRSAGTADTKGWVLEGM